MRKSRFNEEQIIAILKESEAGVETGELCRRHGITRASFYRWKSKYGGMDVGEARRLKHLFVSCPIRGDVKKKVFPFPSVRPYVLLLASSPVSVWEGWWLTWQTDQAVSRFPRESFITSWVLNALQLRKLRKHCVG